MPTNLAIDDRLLDEALRIGGRATKKATVTEALQEYIARRKQQDVIKLFGTIEWESSSDYKKQWRRRSVIVDTSVWSASLRRTATARVAAEAAELVVLVREGRALLLGPVRQELLSGIRVPEQFKTLRRTLRAFPELRLVARDYEEAAECHNRCRSRGVQGSSTDFLLCAAALVRGLSICSTDRDFERYAKILRVKLHRPRA